MGFEGAGAPRPRTERYEDLVGKYDTKSMQRKVELLDSGPKEAIAAEMNNQGVCVPKDALEMVNSLLETISANDNAEAQMMGLSQELAYLRKKQDVGNAAKNFVSLLKRYST